MPKIIASAPTRLSLFGGGTDVPPFCFENGGAVINLAIDKRTEVVLENGELSYQTGGGSGLGSSGSLLVAILGALKTYGGIEIDKQEIAEEAFDIEVNQWGWHGGWQDQFAAAYGGFNLISSDKDGIVCEPLFSAWIESFIPWMVLFDTGVKRESGKIQDGFKKLDRLQIRALLKLEEMVGVAEYLFKGRMHRQLGKLFDKSWEQKKQSNKVSNKELDEMYKQAKKAGALGGKVLGAGRGGHFLFIIKPSEREPFIKKMEEFGLKHIPFKPDFKGLEVKCEH